MKKPNLHCTSSELDKTFRFDSRTSYRPSKSKSKVGVNMDLDMSQRTSEIVRFAQGNNQNILQLLEESEEQNKHKKEQKPERTDLWDFFARFEKESNPDITISQIQVPTPRLPTKAISRPQKHHSTQQRHSMDLLQNRQQFIFSNNQNLESQNTSSRYPKRNRIAPFRYWMGERYIYQHGRIIDIYKIDEDTTD